MYEGITITSILIGIGFIVLSKKGSTADKIQEIKHLNKDEYDEYGARIDELNHKILELNDFSEYIRNEMDKKHKELLFLYQMVNEKSKEMRLFKETPNNDSIIGNEVADVKELEVKKDQGETKVKEINRNKMILELSEKGYDVTQIAQMLDLGRGEVNLVLHLYE